MYKSGWPLVPGSHLHPCPHPSGQEGGCEHPEVTAGHLPAGASPGSSVGTWVGGYAARGLPPVALPRAPVIALLRPSPSLDIWPGQVLWLWGPLPAEVLGEERPRGGRAGCGRGLSGPPGTAQHLPWLQWGGRQWVSLDLAGPNTHPSLLIPLTPAPKGLPPNSTPARGPPRATHWESPELGSLKGPPRAFGTQSKESSGLC